MSRDEFHRQYSELEPSTTLEILKKEAQKGTKEIDNKLIIPDPLRIERCKLESDHIRRERTFDVDLTFQISLYLI